MKEEIVLYRLGEKETHLEVKVENETVWLNPGKADNNWLCCLTGM